MIIRMHQFQVWCFHIILISICSCHLPNNLVINKNEDVFGTSITQDKTAEHCLKNMIWSRSTNSTGLVIIYHQDLSKKTFSGHFCNSYNFSAFKAKARSVAFSFGLHTQCWYLRYRHLENIMISGRMDIQKKYIAHVKQTNKQTKTIHEL